ncbi:heat shock factor protein 5-like [Corvus hawaiiensis]|uniref:heat shock factor protein 5-like n=1 Tax=Corvus hawaiiensis TaxID=134902 RepID=UPI00201A1E08|nr:heat shock factor protein 5-like [Corvus hawaiiensis]XP_048147078.1 heat shock factor protein 5-like [Corvus hawaiiensis]XP_048147079.1 heat shock factor protein 5-like [Corvus hawaiiensis]XP_048147080.1 heat shock factor protein 5-like [Corvus hawaiiensis]XP_048147081.1 heat shock factor protein 5-like [Corvus hawaiiensis]XP_048147083.1 heat shock factor protein 5-like [Corvus hawaiiensis]XP_048147084.1 heat shock factor protein 5-like [Corvus hawaiiensis]XP_048147085.1 heat shock factor
MAELPLPAGLDASTFPAKLWRLANSPRVRSVRWDTQGRGLLIDRALFEQELLSPPGADGAGRERGAAVPDSFKATHFGSVVRQLNLYGFQKVLGCFGAAVPGDAGPIVHFQNPNFRRDRPDLLLRIKRLTRANRQRLAAGLEVRGRQRSRFQQLNTERPLLDFLAGHPPSAAPSYQHLGAVSPEGLELPPRPPKASPGAQESDTSPPPPKRMFTTSGLPGVSSEEPGTWKFPLKRELIIPLVRMDLKRHPELMVPLVPVDRQRTSVALPQKRSCTSSEQHTPAYSPSATPGSSAPSAPPGSAGWAAWTASSWAWNSPGQEELPPLDLDLVLETLEEMLSPSLPERSPCAQVNLSVAPESSGGEAGNRAAAEGALPGAMSCRKSSLEPEEPDIHLIYLSRRAALRGRKGPRESL